MKNQFRSKVFKQAYAIVENTDCRFSEALTEAWRLYRLNKAMQEKPVSFSYMTVSGKVKETAGTINTVKLKTNKPHNYGTVVYYDLGAQAIRSFRAENLIDFAA